MHCCRAWQLFDWVRSLPEGQVVRRLCDSNTYVTMITLCGPWHQLPRALHLMADMQAQQMECGPQVPYCETQSLLLPSLQCLTCTLLL